MSTTTESYTYVLKGSPQYAIDANGVMSITTTWMVIPKNDANHRTPLDWLSFSNDVETWAGKVGDPYKRPKVSKGREAEAYEEDTKFIVTDIEYHCVEGRTHYEVTFSHTQNFSEMRMIGNVSAEINENNEKTKSITYQLMVASAETAAIDEQFVNSGDTVDWAGTEYLVTSSSYNAISPTMYEINITAKDMSVMLIGNPQKSVDAFGQQTMSATKRYSNTAYADASLPEAGEPVSAWLDLGGWDGYIVTDVSHEPDGVLGYLVTVTAKHVSKRLVKVSKQQTRKTTGAGFYTTNNIQYQSDSEHVLDFDNIIGDRAEEYAEDAIGVVSDVSIDSSGKNDYDIQITTTDEPAQGAEASANDLRDEVSVSMSQSGFVLTPQQAGWFTGLSGEYYMINFPPKTTYNYSMDVTTLQEASGKTPADILQLVQSGTDIGYDSITGVQAFDKDHNLIWLSPDKRRELQSLSSVSKVMLCGYVYAQPEMKSQGESLRSLLFRPWTMKKYCPVIVPKMGKTSGRDNGFDLSALSYKIAVMEISVGMNYKGKAAKIMKKDVAYYYEKAIDYIANANFTSYKGTGINVSETRDEEGDVWTNVVCNISAIHASNRLYYDYADRTKTESQLVYSTIRWNDEYDSSFVSHTKGTGAWKAHDEEQ